MRQMDIPCAEAPRVRCRAIRSQIKASHVGCAPPPQAQQHRLHTVHELGQTYHLDQCAQFGQWAA